MNYLALYRDIGPCSDGHTRSLGIFPSAESARTVVLTDVQRYCSSLLQLQPKIEDDGILTTVRIGYDEYLCEWEVMLMECQ